SDVAGGCLSPNWKFGCLSHFRQEMRCLSAFSRFTRLHAACSLSAAHHAPLRRIRKGKAIS
ncbi:hypothetical protein, partial [uncultured Mailhella sp.]|uniref:hypothetical protein n=1 Tax=uncultured Mailhella sp. TaxID=1981031 RepID=UPI00261AAC3C